ncbi:MAG: DUF4097 family beta strand repeat-containing protein [Stackebrandtia sp.]
MSQTESQSQPQAGRPRRSPMVAVIIGVAVLALLAAAGVWTWKSFKDVRTEQLSDSYDAPLTRVDLDGDAGDVTVTVTDTDAVIVDKELSYNEDKPKSEETVSGETLTIRATECSGPSLGFNHCHINYRIQVPADVALDITTDSGEIDTEDVTADQKLHADSGNIRVDDAGGEAELETDSGDIEAHGVAGGFTATADSGNITADGLRSTSATANADSGDIDLGFDVSPDEIKSIAESGGVTITVPEDGESYDVDVTTDSGDQDIQVTSDSASDKKITAEADSGDVTIQTR